MTRRQSDNRAERTIFAGTGEAAGQQSMCRLQEERRLAAALRCSMGILESRRVPVHSMFGHTSIYGDTYQQRFVSFSPVKPSLPAISMVIKSLTTDYPVKSIDLDMWTPEQMESVQKWGNRRANLYWERHLKAGHVPAEHKIESFIRSKYESKRWAMDGPLPSEPRLLEDGASQAQPPPINESARPTPTTTAPPAAPAGRQTHPLLSRATASKPQLAPVVDLFADDDGPSYAPAPTPATTDPPAVQPASSAPAATSPPATSAAAPPAPTAGSNIFDLDFRAPTPSSAKPQNAKADIMSLFSSNSPGAAPPTQSFFSPPSNSNPYASWGGGVTSTAPPAPPVQQAATQAPVSGNGGWGGMQMDQSAWGAPARHTQPAMSPFEGNADPWATSGGFGGSPPAPVVAKKEERDPFANIWS